MRTQETLIVALATAVSSAIFDACARVQHRQIRLFLDHGRKRIGHRFSMEEALAGEHLVPHHASGVRLFLKPSLSRPKKIG